MILGGWCNFQAGAGLRVGASANLAPLTNLRAAVVAFCLVGAVLSPATRHSPGIAPDRTNNL